MQKQDIPRISGSPRRKNSPSQWIAIWLSRMLFSSQQWYRNQNYGLFTATSVIVTFTGKSRAAKVQSIHIWWFFQSLRAPLHNLSVPSCPPYNFLKPSCPLTYFFQSLRAPPHDWERAVKDWYNEVSAIWTNPISWCKGSLQSGAIMSRLVESFTTWSILEQVVHSITL